MHCLLDVFNIGIKVICVKGTSELLACKVFQFLSGAKFCRIYNLRLKTLIVITHKTLVMPIGIAGHYNKYNLQGIVCFLLIKFTGL